MPSDLAEKRKTDRLFLEQLLDTSKLDNYSVPVSIKADLRKYQQACHCVVIIVQSYLAELSLVSEGMKVDHKFFSS